VTIASVHRGPGAQGGVGTELVLDYQRASLTHPASTPGTTDTTLLTVPVQHDVLPTTTASWCRRAKPIAAE
jgi:hypothetical protein